MDFRYMSNNQIIKEIAKNIEETRRDKRISMEEMAKRGGFSVQTYSNFINKNTDIKLTTLIQIFKGLGELNKLEKNFLHEKPFSIIGNTKKTPQRIRKTKKTTTKIIWGDEN